MNQFSPIAFGACLAFCTPGAAQGPDPLEGLTVPWPASLPGIFTDALAFEATADGVPDLAVVRGGNVVFLYNPSNHASATLLQGNVNGIAVLPGAGYMGASALITAGSQGLRLWKYNCQFPQQAQPVLLDVELEGTVSLGARAVASGDLDGDGDSDLVAVLPGGSAINTFLNNGSNQFSVGSGWQATHQVSQLAIVRWGSSLSPCVVAHTSWGLKLYTPTGQLLSFARNYQAGDAMTVTSLPSGESVVFWTTRSAASPSTLQRMYFWRESGLSTAMDLNLTETPSTTSPGIVRMDFGDWDGDNDQDLALSVTQSTCVLELRNGPEGSPGNLGVPAFDGHPSSFVPVQVSHLTGAAPNNLAAVVCEDFNGDHQDDVALAIQDESMITVRVSNPVQGSLNEGDCTHPVYERATLYFQGGDSPYDVNGDVNGAFLRVFLHDGWGTHTGADHLEVVVWEQPWPCSLAETNDPGCPNVGPSAPYLLPDAARHSFYALPGQALPASAFIDVPIAPSADDPAFYKRYFIETRLVDTVPVTGGLRVVQAWTTYPLGFAREDGPEFLPNGPVACMEELPLAGCRLPLEIGGSEALPSIGVIIPAPREPDFEPGITPRIPPAGSSGYLEGG